MELVQNADERKAPAELFIRKFARVYTPIVIILTTNAHGHEITKKTKALYNQSLNVNTNAGLISE